MADGGGFHLNIAASSAAPRVQKKKKSLFRSKQKAHKNAKAKARQADGSNGTSGGGSGGAQIRHAKPQRPTTNQNATPQPPRGTKPTGPVVREEKKKPGVVNFTNKQARAQPTVAEPLVEESEQTETHDNTNDDNEDDSEEEEYPEPVMASGDGEDDDMDAIIARSLAVNAKQEAVRQEDGAGHDENATTDGAAVGAETSGDAAADAAKKPFGTRKNPNKENYVPEAFTTVRTTIDHVLDRPLASSASEKIFALTTFESMKLHPRLIDILKKDTSSQGFGFARPTTVQVKTIPHVLAGKDVMVKSETGSGKTLSYLLPIVQKLQSIEPRIGRDDGCLALILAPTRELCQQIQETAEKLTKAFVFLVPGMVVGGEKKKSEKARLRKGLAILIATPGRLADHLVNTQSFNYSRLQFLVLDEADRLLDMGFQKQITQILEIIDATTKHNKYTGGRRQNLLVSATINSGVQELAKMSLVNPVRIDADKEMAMETKQMAGDPNKQEQFNTPHQLQQHFMIVPAKTRLCGLTCFLRQELTSSTRKKCKIVVFMSTCDAVDFHYALFQKCAWPAGKGSQKKTSDASPGDSDDKKDKLGAASPLFGPLGSLFRLHGNIPQQERTSTFKNFCSSTNGVLICTDVAARGLNLPTVQWIVQYDPPTETRDYVHRVGRTARSGNEGSSLLFLMPSESEYLDYLKKHNLSLNALSLEKTVARVASGGGFMKSNKKLVHEVVQSDLQYLFEQTLLGDASLFELACQGFHSFVRSYATHSSDTRGIFHVRGLHFGHIAKSFALREPPASTKLRDSGVNAKKGTLQKRRERDEKYQQVSDRRVKQKKFENRKFAHHLSEFAG